MIIDVKQGTEEWQDVRRGRFTASRISELLPGVKGSYLASRKNYIHEILCERLTGVTQPGFVSAAMEHGTNTEAEARIAYMYYSEYDVVEAGIAIHDNFDYLAASPDGLVLASHGIEIKCPNTATHINTFLTGKVDRKYIIQMQVNMMCCDLRRWDFVSFDNRLPEKAQLYIQQFEYNETLANQIIKEVIQAEAEVNELMEKLS